MATNKVKPRAKAPVKRPYQTIAEKPKPQLVLNMELETKGCKLLSTAKRENKNTQSPSLDIKSLVQKAKLALAAKKQQLQEISSSNYHELDRSAFRKYLHQMEVQAQQLQKGEIIKPKQNHPASAAEFESMDAQFEERISHVVADQPWHKSLKKAAQLSNPQEKQMLISQRNVLGPAFGEYGSFLIERPQSNAIEHINAQAADHGTSNKKRKLLDDGGHSWTLQHGHLHHGLCMAH